MNDPHTQIKGGFAATILNATLSAVAMLGQGWCAVAGQWPGHGEMVVRLLLGMTIYRAAVATRQLRAAPDAVASE